MSVQLDLYCAHRALALGRADARPRIHVWPHPNGVSWSIGPTGTRTPAPTRLVAMADGLAHLGEPEAFVVIGEVQS